MKFKNFGRRFRRSLRAVSPVIAVLLMIVIAVASALFAYAWVMGYLDFLTVKVDQGVQVQAINWDGVDTITAYAQNVGPSDVTIANVYIDDVLDINAQVIDPALMTEDWVLPSGETRMIVSSGIYTGADNQVTVKLTTADGNIFMLKKTVTTATGGGGGVVTPPPTVTRVNTHVEDVLSLSGGVGTETWTTAPTAGNFLVLVAGHRQGDPFDHYNTMTVDGWTRDEVAYGTAGNGDTSHRRICVVFSRVADGTANDNPTIHWNDPDSSGVSVCYMILQEFSTTGGSITKVASGNAENGDSGGGTTMPVPGSALSTSSENILAIGGMSSRGGVTGLSFSGLSGLLELTPEPSGSSIEGASAYDYTPGAATVLQTTISWTTSTEACGLLVLYSCSG